MKITKRQLRRIVESFSEYDGHRSISEMGAEVADAVMRRYPHWHLLKMPDELPLERIVDKEIANLHPGPFDDEWVDVLESAMAVLLDQKEGERY